MNLRLLLFAALTSSCSLQTSTISAAESLEQNQPLRTFERCIMPRHFSYPFSLNVDQDAGTATASIDAWAFENMLLDDGNLVEDERRMFRTLRRATRVDLPDLGWRLEIQFAIEDCMPPANDMAQLTCVAAGDDLQASIVHHYPTEPVNRLPFVDRVRAVSIRIDRAPNGDAGDRRLDLEMTFATPRANETYAEKHASWLVPCI